MNSIVLYRTMSLTEETELPGSNLLLLPLWQGSKLNFQVANSILATVNFEPCQCEALEGEPIPYSGHTWGSPRVSLRTYLVPVIY